MALPGSVTAAIALGAALLAAPAAATEQRIGPLDRSAGPVTATVFPDSLECPGSHPVKIWFVPFTVLPQFAPVQWLELPATTTLGPDAAYVDVRVPLDRMAPGRYSGAIFYQCDSCGADGCTATIRSDLVHVDVAAPALFGASPADQNFGGLVNGQPVSIHDLTVNVLGDIKRSSFMQLTGAATVVQVLEEHYLDRSLGSKALSDVTFVRTVGTTDQNGKMSSKVQPVDDEDVAPGNGRYTRQEDAVAGVVVLEEIYVGVDLSLQGITAARRNPDRYYVFLLDGQLGVVNKADFVHNLMHEGHHAAIAGKYNTAKPSGGMAASLEEEKEGFRVGNAAARALGLPEDPTTPGANYGGGSNTGYPIQFPQLVPGQEATDPTRMATTPAGGAPTTPAAPPGQSSATPSRQAGTEPGFCRNDGPALRCDGVPGYALDCDASLPPGQDCTIEGTGLRAPCSFGAAGWNCTGLPPAVTRCTGGLCAVGATGTACWPDGRGFSCGELPTYRLDCAAAGTCTLADALAGTASVAPGDLPGVLYGVAQSTDCNRAGSGVRQALVPFATAATTASSPGDAVAGDIQSAFARELAAAPGLPAQSFIFTIAPAASDLPARAWPGTGGDLAGADDAGWPQRGTVEVTPASTGRFNHAGSTYQLQGGLFGSVTVPAAVNGNAPALDPFVAQRLGIGATPHTTLLYEAHREDAVLGALRAGGYPAAEANPCRTVLVPTDPHYRRTGRNGGNSWGARRDDQWAIKRVGYTDDASSAWQLVPASPAPVVVAVIDTGLDWHHADLDPANIWRNDGEIPDNGSDDDGNGYVDDVIGWDFAGRTNRPWDHDGHGTLVTGIIAARHNDAGIAGISPNARIMVLKGANDLGTTRASWLAEAIVYAVDNGARVINLSIGGRQQGRIEQAALDHARQHDVLVVAAAGNDGAELDDFGPGGHDSVLTVGATRGDDRAAEFSNFGARLDLVAPGVDVLGLRARRTDVNFRPWQDDSYRAGTYVVGADQRYLRASGTSFATPIVTATAALLLGRNPRLTAAELEGILVETATDLEAPGRDPYTGHGLLDARAALAAAPGFRLVAEISQVELLPAGAPTHAHVRGTIDAPRFKRAWLQLRAADQPGAWRFVGPKRKYPIRAGELAAIPLAEFPGKGSWQVIVNVEDRSGVVRRAAFPVQIP